MQRNEWKADATTFLRDHASAFSAMPVAMFLTSMSFALDPDRERQLAQKLELLRNAAGAAACARCR